MPHLKASRVLAIINQAFSYSCMGMDMFIVLYKSLVRPILEYASPTWSPFLKKDIDKLEKIQRRATKLVPTVSHLSYEQRLRSLGLPTLQYRRDRQHVLHVFQTLHLNSSPDLMAMFTVNTDSLRGHDKKLKKVGHTNKNTRLNFFSKRVINNWNNLPQEVVNASSINNFKSLLNNYSWHTH